MSLPAGDGGVHTVSGNSLPPWIMRSLPLLSVTRRSDVPGMNTMSHGAVTPSATNATRIFCLPALSVSGSPALGRRTGAAGGGCERTCVPKPDPNVRAATSPTDCSLRKSPEFLLFGRGVDATVPAFPPPYCAAMRAPIALSKTKLLSLTQCRRKLWLETYNPELLPEPSAEKSALLSTGNVVGE